MLTWKVLSSDLSAYACKTCVRASFFGQQVDMLDFDRRLLGRGDKVIDPVSQLYPKVRLHLTSPKVVTYLQIASGKATPYCLRCHFLTPLLLLPSRKMKYRRESETCEVVDVDREAGAQWKEQWGLRREGMLARTMSKRTPQRTLENK